MNLDELRMDCSIKQKKGLHFILASVMIWFAVFFIHSTSLPILAKNLLTFCFTAPLLPIAYFISKLIKVDFQNKSNPLNNLGVLFPWIKCFTCSLPCGSIRRFQKRCSWSLRWSLEHIFYLMAGYINQKATISFQCWFRFSRYTSELILLQTNLPFSWLELKLFLASCWSLKIRSWQNQRFNNNNNNNNMFFHHE